MPYFEKSREPKPAFVTGGRETRGEVAFDEASWPPAPVYREAYAEALTRGQARMARSRVAITGLVRDSEACLPLNLARLQKLGSLFADYRILLFENDSVDSTPKLLAEAARRNPRLIAHSETLGQQRWGSVRHPQRAAEMAHYRNRCQALIAETCGDFDHVVVADLDLEGWSYDGVANTLGQDGWDAVASSGIHFRNGRPMFFDGWAFRTLGDAPARRHALRTMVFPRGTPPIRLASAFSGLAVYRMEAFAAGRYGGEDCARGLPRDHGASRVRPVLPQPEHDRALPRCGARLRRLAPVEACGLDSIAERGRVSGPRGSP